MPLNQILYGPPGTGKTYHTIEAAVQAAEPEFYANLNISEQAGGASEEQRTKLVEKYKELTRTGQIRFVTFHQSYGYEEFVEGLKANSEGGDISY
ncbi:AAA family ATPase, partial [Vibrio sp. 10N.222.55.C6]